MGLKKYKHNSGKYLIARNGEIIGQWFPKNIRYLKNRENLRPSDHIFKNGEWQLLFKATNGYFWRWVKRDTYEEMHREETSKAKKYLKTYRLLAAETNVFEAKNKHLQDALQYEELLNYLQNMLKRHKLQWATKFDKIKTKPLNRTITFKKSPK